MPQLAPRGTAPPPSLVKGYVIAFLNTLTPLHDRPETTRDIAAVMDRREGSRVRATEG